MGVIGRGVVEASCCGWSERHILDKEVLQKGGATSEKKKIKKIERMMKKDLGCPSQYVEARLKVGAGREGVDLCVDNLRWQLRSIQGDRSVPANDVPGAHLEK